jgi:hypothetical protein
MFVDNNCYLMKIGGRPKDSTAWTAMWAIGTYYSDSYDLYQDKNRTIAKGGYMVWRQGTAAAVAAGGTTVISLVTSASAALTAPTVLWTTVTLTHDVTEAAFKANKLVYAVKLPRRLSLRYVGVCWTLAVAAWTAGTADIFLTPNAPYTQVGAV